MTKKYTEELIPAWCEGTLSPEERKRLVKWTEESVENRQLFANSIKTWEAVDHLRRMKKFDPVKAIQRVHSKTGYRKLNQFGAAFQKAAAVLVFPLILGILYFFSQDYSQQKSTVAWHTIETPAGIRSEFVLPDSTKVWLNSKTTLSYPLTFNGSIREVRLKGKAYFEVTGNKRMPFIVKTGEMNVEVTGTEFIASNYPHENLTEIVLIEGEINLFQGDYFQEKKDIIILGQGERASLKRDDTEVFIDRVDEKKYKAWRNGILMFRDDSMKEVVRRLNRWFNVDIQLTGPDLKDYVYTATFEDESLNQILELLKLSAPIDYTIKKRERKNDKTFSKMEIVIVQK